MRIPINTNKEPMVLRIKVQTTHPENIMIRVADAFKPQSDYFKEWFPVKGERTFDISMPSTPKKAVVLVYNKRIGDVAEAKDTSFKLIRDKDGNPGEILPIKRHPELYNMNSDLLKEATEFIEWFSQNASILSANGSVYRSRKGTFRIDYLDKIYDRASGTELKTPARISQDRGIIEVSKDLFIPYSIPYRDAILSHEISHFYINTHPADEEEADYHALRLFLGRGYTCIDAQRAFLNVFETVPSDTNVQRQEKIEAFVTAFAKRNGLYIGN
jgi:hypothetical protein